MATTSWFYLSEKQPKEIQNLAMVLFHEFIRKDRDYIWVMLAELSGKSWDIPGVGFTEIEVERELGMLPATEKDYYGNARSLLAFLESLDVEEDLEE